MVPISQWPGITILELGRIVSDFSVQIKVNDWNRLGILGARPIRQSKIEMTKKNRAHLN